MAATHASMEELLRDGVVIGGEVFDTKTRDQAQLPPLPEGSIQPICEAARADGGRQALMVQAGDAELVISGLYENNDYRIEKIEWLGADTLAVFHREALEQWSTEVWMRLVDATDQVAADAVGLATPQILARITTDNPAPNQQVAVALDFGADLDGPLHDLSMPPELLEPKEQTLGELGLDRGWQSLHELGLPAMPGFADVELREVDDGYAMQARIDFPPVERGDEVATWLNTVSAVNAAFRERYGAKIELVPLGLDPESPFGLDQPVAEYQFEGLPAETTVAGLADLLYDNPRILAAVEDARTGRMPERLAQDLEARQAPASSGPEATGVDAASPRISVEVREVSEGASPGPAKSGPAVK